MVDVFVIANSEARYGYSTLAENYYHASLTDEKIRKQKLPQIGKTEFTNAGMY